MQDEHYLERAEKYAEEFHASINQRRKYSGEPYIVHPREVVRLARPFITYEPALAAFFNHDQFEDVLPLNPYYTFGRFESLFGRDARVIAQDMTDVYTKGAYPKLNRKARKSLEIERWRIIGNTELGYYSQTGKVCDLISNTRDITSQDPGFAKTYLKEKEALMKVLTRANRDLWFFAMDQLETSKALINK